MRLSRLIFWETPRTSWQYDIIVALILGFIFLTPRGAFRDQPHPVSVVQIPAVRSISQHAGETVFWIDAALLRDVSEAERGRVAVELVQKRTGKKMRLNRLELVADPDEEAKGFMAFLEP